MKKLETYYRVVPWFMASLLSVLAVGCGGGSGGGNGQQPILGIGGDIATIAPAVTAVSPPSGAIAVPINSKLITAAFNKPMNPATLSNTSFTLACPGTNPIAGTTVTYSTVGNVATLTLPAASNLPVTSVCTATVTTAVKDTFGIPLAANFTWLFTTGPALDSTAPTVTSTTNANGAAGVSINTSVGATFSETMDATTVNVGSFTLKQGATAVVGTVNYFGVSTVFTPNSPLALNTTYTATIKGGVAAGVKDVAGNAMVSDYVWSWTTSTGLDPNAGRDTTPPTVTGTVNANGATGVAINTKVGASFSEAMDPLKMTNANFTLQNAVTGAAVAGTVNYSGITVVFAPLTNLAPSTRYTATIKGAPTGVSDLAGNMLQSDYVWSWTTGAAADTTAPTVTSTIHANGETNVAFNTKVGATFSEGMDPLSITNASFVLTQTVGGAVVAGGVGASGVAAIFIPQVNLLPSTNYTVTIKGGASGVKDLAGNPMVSDFVIRWTTGAALDTTAPTVTSTSPANGDTNVAFNSRVSAIFSEGLDPLTVNSTTFRVTESVSGAVVAGGLGYSGLSAVFIPLVNFAPSTRYTLTVKGGTSGLKDLAGNTMASDFVIGWTTGATPDTTAPTVTAVNPADLATNVPVNTSVSATFSEAMDALTMNTANFGVAGVTGLVSFDAPSKTITFKPSSNLAENTTYTATVSTGVKDIAGNALAANTVWRFTTVAPIVVPPIVPSVNLGTASTYGTFGGTAGMTNMGTLTVVNGNIGTTATGASSITGFHDTGGDIYTETGSNRGTVNGLIYSCTVSTVGPTSAGVNAPSCALATQARLDAQTAYLFLAAKPPGANPGANLAGKTLAPGVYTAPSGAFLIEGGNLTLDAQGDANAQFIFQMASTLTVGGPGAAFPQSIILAGGAQAKNVFWQVGSFATINAGGGGTMVGTIISQAGVSFSTAGNVSIVTLNGRALSLGASVTLVNTVINVP